MKTTRLEMKNTLDGIKIRIQMAEEKINELPRHNNEYYPKGNEKNKKKNQDGGAAGWLSRLSI